MGTTGAARRVGVELDRMGSAIRGGGGKGRATNIAGGQVRVGRWMQACMWHPAATTRCKNGGKVESSLGRSISARVGRGVCMRHKLQESGQLR